MGKPYTVAYVGVSGSKADWGLGGFAFALADIEIMEHAIRDGLPDSIFQEYYHLLEHAIAEDIRRVLWPAKYASLKRRFLKWKHLAPGTDAWFEATADLHGSLCGSLVLVAGAYYAER